MLNFVTPEMGTASINQTFTKMYNLSSALAHGTIFPELYLIDSLMYNKELHSTPKKRNGGRK